MKTLFLLLMLAVFKLSAEIYPNGGETIYKNSQGSSLTIKWGQDDFKGAIDIFIWNYSIGEYQVITRQINSDLLAYNWQIPSYITPGDYYRIKIQESDNPQKYLMSKTYFSILEIDNNKIPSNNLIANEEISIFPHPIDDYTNIRSKNFQMIYLKLYDSSGQIIYSTSETSYSYYVSFDYISSGQYIAEIGFENELKIIQKILVVK